jgi:hypothetical protein
MAAGAARSTAGAASDRRDVVIERKKRNHGQRLSPQLQICNSVVSLV